MLYLMLLILMLPSYRRSCNLLVVSLGVCYLWACCQDIAVFLHMFIIYLRQCHIYGQATDNFCIISQRQLLNVPVDPHFRVNSWFRVQVFIPNRRREINNNDPFLFSNISLSKKFLYLNDGYPAISMQPLFHDNRANTQTIHSRGYLYYYASVVQADVGDKL